MHMIRQHESPNCGSRRGGLVPQFVILHYTAMASADAAISYLCNPQAEVSAHYVISKSGQITQLVGEGQRAWHAGAGEWQGLDDMNSRSIGIELDNDGESPFAAPLMDSLEALLVRITGVWDIPPDHVIGHSDMAPGRKIDPGRFFDWQRLASKGLAAPAAPSSQQLEANPALFRQRAQACGYTALVDDEALLQAVRLRHRPLATGPLDPADIAVLSLPTRSRS
jgi:N-acetylmuramoyl-L-alanine amidase